MKREAGRLSSAGKWYYARLFLSINLFFILLTFSPSHLLTFLPFVSELRTPNSSLCLVSEAYALDVPPLRGYVNDYANMMSDQTRAKITKELKAFEQSDSTQLVVLTIPSLQDEALEDFSIKVAETWKIGQKGKGNGIILLVANQERKIRIEVGRGLEGRLTDLVAGRIIDLVIKPRFKRGDYDGGFIAGVHALVDATRGEFKAEARPASARKRQGSPIPAMLIFGAIVLFTLGRISRVLGGAAGAVGLPGIAYLTLGSSMITLILLGVLGLFLGIFLPTLFSGRHGGGGGSSGFFYTGGSWGSGSDSGGSGFGGDFGGGGGDFGGGGASGDW
ncbi:MAG: hypothetical protein A4E64_03053 [Syntrophorhabdus sp. PtaU1.Bin058]|nr:MAG: hypothetical protein A4E64_03053 [Syntrophorhabdus sp. PtaU1.Bin058]